VKLFPETSGISRQFENPAKKLAAKQVNLQGIRDKRVNLPSDFFRFYATTFKSSPTKSKTRF
jgi:hypothetical protein